MEETATNIENPDHDKLPTDTRSNEDLKNVEGILENDKQSEKTSSPTKELLMKQKKLIQPSITEFTKSSSTAEESDEDEAQETSSSVSEEDAAELQSVSGMDRKKIFTIIHSSLSEEHDRKQRSDANESDGKNEADEETVKTSNDAKTQAIKIKIAEVKSTPPPLAFHKTDVPKPHIDEPVTRRSSFLKMKESEIIPVKASINQASSNKEFRSYSKFKNKIKPADINMTTEGKEIGDKTKVFERETNRGGCGVGGAGQQFMQLKKRKLSADDTSTVPCNKLVKIVPIESILNKGKEPLAQKPARRKSDPGEMLVENIKSEPESDDEMQQYLAAKKRFVIYLHKFLEA